ncbi:MAG: hypothetical protein QF464_13880, partial [Myxococcota bacterium]|nr:hypothetical protein [Myxococcota bacterium]
LDAAPPESPSPPDDPQGRYVPGMASDGVPLIDRMHSGEGPSHSAMLRLVAQTPARRARLRAPEDALDASGGLRPEARFELAEVRREEQLHLVAERLVGWKPPKCPPRKRCYSAQYFMPAPDYRAAVADLRTLLEAHPDWSGAPRARYHLGLMLSRRGPAKDEPAAMAAFLALVRAHPASEWSVPSRSALGSYLMRQKDPTAARPHLEAVCRTRYLYAPQSCRSLASLQAAAGQYAAAIASLEGARERCAAEPELHGLVAGFDADLIAAWSHVDGGWKAARDHLRSVVVESARAQQLLLEMAEQLVSQGRRSEAIALLEALRSEAAGRRDARKIDAHLDRLRE